MHYFSRIAPQFHMTWLACRGQACPLFKKADIGSRSLDFQHISSATFLEMEGIVTFDDRQAQLSIIAGLKIIDIPAI